VVIGTAGVLAVAAADTLQEGATPGDLPVGCRAAVQAVSPSEGEAVAKKPTPELLPLCLIEICKLRNNGQLVHCTVTVTDTCCRYKTNEDCTPVSTCPEGVGIYCNGSSPGGEPPNGCSGTCN